MSARSQVINKVACVTGASRGIGLSIALRLAKDGYDVAINDIAANQAGIDAAVTAIQSLGRKSVGVVADVTDEAQVESMVAQIVAALGSLDVMVANAGVCQVKALLETTAADRKFIMDVNVHGLMNTFVSAARQMVKQGKGGRIIGAASIAAYSTHASLATYCTSKFAVHGFTQASAKEWGKYGIRVNSYAPGIVDTNMWANIDEVLGAEQGLKAGQHMDDMRKGIVLGRVSVPDDVAKLVSFLASEEAEYITGQTMIVDGGICFT